MKLFQLFLTLIITIPLYGIANELRKLNDKNK
jgi:hypothetical protein